MSTQLHNSPIYGPVHSRRLGLSVGINLMPADGKYCLFARVMFDTKPVSHHDSLFFGIDGAPMIAGALAHQYDKTEFNKTQWIQFFDGKLPKRAQWPVFLKKGKHTIRISPREEINIGMIAITLDPQAFRGK